MAINYTTAGPSEAVMNLYAGSTWTTTLTPIESPVLPITDVVMEIRNAPGILMGRLSLAEGGVVVNGDNSITLTIPAATSMTWGQGLPGSEIVIGFEGPGFSYPYDVFAQSGESWYKILYGWFRITPSVTRSLVN